MKFHMTTGSKPPAPNIGYLLSLGCLNVAALRTSSLKIAFSNGVQTAGASLPVACGFSQGTGNSTVALARQTPNGSPSTALMKYIHATDTPIQVPAVLYNAYRAAAASNSEIAVFCGGGNSSTNTTTSSSEFVYSNDAGQGGGSLDDPRSLMAAGGNASFSYFAGGSRSTLPRDSQNTVWKRDYVSRVRVTIDSLTVARQDLACYSNADETYFMSGVNGAGTTVGTRERYMHATDARVSMPAYATSSLGMGAAANAATGCTFGGQPSAGSVYSQLIVLYNFAANSNVFATSVGQITNPCAASSAPGNF